MFTLAHELAHLWIDAAGISNFEALQPSNMQTEQFCNKVAAEFLIPQKEIKAIWHKASSDKPFDWLAKRFKVSPLVSARRALDLGLIKKQDFFKFYDDDQKKVDLPCRYAWKDIR